MEQTFPMTGGDGPNSYVVNSQKQKEAAEMAKAMLVGPIAQNIDIKSSSSGRFTIVDLGCSTGPNTFFAVENIIEAIIHKFKTEGQYGNLEFLVFFNDLVANDFNTLFASLPPNRCYFAAATPGSFYGRLFPQSYINFFNSTFSLQWLSKTPDILRDMNSPACNHGRIYYGNAPNEVGLAYFAQFAKDIEVFLDSRAKELVSGGLMSILMPGRPEGTIASQGSLGPYFEPIESCLLDLADEGILSREKIDSFNLPIYSPSVDEIRTMIEKNGQFSIVKLNLLPQPSRPFSVFTARELRAGFENIFTMQFGRDFTDLLFEKYTEKFGEATINTDRLSVGLFTLLKRNS